MLLAKSAKCEKKTKLLLSSLPQCKRSLSLALKGCGVARPFGAKSTVGTIISDE